jgi:hypothetical protein
MCLALVNLAFPAREGRDHGAVGRFRHIGRQSVRFREPPRFRDNLLDALGIVDRLGIPLEARRFVHVFPSFGHGADQLAVDAIDIVAYLAEALTALAAIDAGRPPLSRRRRARFLATRGERGKGDESEGGKRGAMHGRSSKAKGVRACGGRVVPVNRRRVMTSQVIALPHLLA